jgi:hypothetical protein
MEAWASLIVVAPVLVLLLGYFWLRLGPKRCPQCRRLTLGYWGPPVGIRRMIFHCAQCGSRFEGHKRLPL